MLPQISGKYNCTLAAFRRAYRANFSRASARVLENADDFDSGQFVLDWIVTLDPRHSLLIEYKKTLFFRQSTNKPLLDLVSAYVDYSQHGGNVERKSLVLVEAVQKVYKYMRRLSIGYAVISSAHATYLVQHVDGADLTYQNCMEISQGYAWASKDPALLKALSYVMNRTTKDEKKFEFQNAGEFINLTFIGLYNAITVLKLYENRRGLMLYLLADSSGT